MCVVWLGFVSLGSPAGMRGFFWILEWNERGPVWDRLARDSHDGLNNIETDPTSYHHLQYTIHPPPILLLSMRAEDTNRVISSDAIMGDHAQPGGFTGSSAPACASGLFSWQDLYNLMVLFFLPDLLHTCSCTWYKHFMHLIYFILMGLQS